MSKLEIAPITPTKKILSTLRKFHKKCFPKISKYEDFPFPKDICYIARIGDKMVGMAMVHKNSPEEFFSRELKIQEHAYLYNFAIHPDHRKKGYGITMFNKIKKYYKELNLAVDHNDIDVIKFYFKCNCRIVGKFGKEWVCMTSETRKK